MTILTAVKGKVLGTALAGALVIGGAGAARASGFGSTAITDGINNLVSFVASLSGNSIDQKAGTESTESVNQVDTSFGAAAGSVNSHYVNKVNAGRAELNTYNEGVKEAIGEAASSGATSANNAVDNEVSTSVAEGKTTIDIAANRRAETLINGANSNGGRTAITNALNNQTNN